MYKSTNQFPEFKGKNKKYEDECMRYVLKKEPALIRQFLCGAVILVILLTVVHFGVGYLSTSEFVRENVGILEIIIIAVGVYGGLLVHINKCIYPAVKKHIAEFDATHDA